MLHLLKLRLAMLLKLKYIRRALQVIAHLYSKHIVYNLEGYLTVGYTRLYLSYLFSYFSVTFICY